MEVDAEPVAVTGIGAVLPSGRGVDALWSAWRRSEPALSLYRDPAIRTKKITGFGHVPEELIRLGRESIPHKQRKFGTDFTFAAALAVQDAVAAAGDCLAGIDEKRRGFYVAQDDSTSVVATSFARGMEVAHGPAGLDFTRMTAEVFRSRGFDPFAVIKGLNNNTLAVLSLAHGFRGDGAAFSQGEGSGVAALSNACRALRRGDCDIAVVVGAGSYNEAMRLAGLYRDGHLSAGNRVRSFDSRRDGTVLAEGAVALVLERTAAARRRAAEPLVEIAGTALHPHNDSTASDAARDLLARAGLAPGDLGAVCANGKGTVRHDADEVRLLETLLQGTAVPVSSVRPITGQLGAAGPLAELALSHRLFQQAELPPVAELREPISEHVDFVTARPRRGRFNSVLNLHRDFNGLTGAVLSTRPTEHS